MRLLVYNLEDGRYEMPTYEYKCEACKKEFIVVMSITEHDETKVICPKCQSDQVEQIISHFIARTSRKS
jgi:putative FmdB family regulatory protein